LAIVIDVDPAIETTEYHPPRLMYIVWPTLAHALVNCPKLETLIVTFDPTAGCWNGDVVLVNAFLPSIPSCPNGRVISSHPPHPELDIS
jgi:hypothetical protein